jgi:hypothetical protein
MLRETGNVLGSVVQPSELQNRLPHDKTSIATGRVPAKPYTHENVQVSL